MKIDFVHNGSPPKESFVNRLPNNQRIYSKSSASSLQSTEIEQCFQKLSSELKGARSSSESKLTTAIGRSPNLNKIWISRQRNKTLGVPNEKEYTSALLESLREKTSIDKDKITASNIFIDAVIDLPKPLKDDRKADSSPAQSQEKTAYHAEMLVLSAIIDYYGLRESVNEMVGHLNNIKNLTEFNQKTNYIITTLKSSLEQIGTIHIAADADACTHCAGMMKALGIDYHSSGKTAKPSTQADWWNPLTGIRIPHSNNPTDQYQSSDILWVKQEHYDKIAKGIEDPQERAKRAINREKNKNTLPSSVSPRTTRPIRSQSGDNRMNFSGTPLPPKIYQKSKNLPASTFFPQCNLSPKPNLTNLPSPLDNKRAALKKEEIELIQQIEKLKTRLNEVQNELHLVEEASKNDRGLF